MAIRTNTPDLVDSPPIPVRATLAAAWTSFMFLFAYVDILALYKPGTVDDILVGVALEVILFAVILRWAWFWPLPAPSATMPTSREADRDQQRV